jgi:signal transduction histidine kinase
MKAGRNEPAASRRGRSRLGRCTAAILAAAAWLAATGRVFAQGQEQQRDLFERLRDFALALNRNEIASLSLTLGILVFAVVTAIAYLRTKSRAAGEHDAARREIARLRAEADRMTALLLSEPQVVVIWRGNDTEPAILGEVASISGRESTRRILAFGSWLGAEPAAAMEAAVDALRKNGQAFAFSLITPRGRHLEAEGRPVGGAAVLRLRDVTGARRDHAAAVAQYRQIESENEQARALIDRMPAPMWIRDGDGRLTYVNRAYAAAVEASSPEDAAARNLELLDQPVRAEVARARPNGPFRRRVPVIVAGARRTLDVFDMPTQRGSAGIAIDVTEGETARAEIRKVTEAHRKTLDQLATGVAIFTANRRLAFYNAAYVTLFRLDTSFLDEAPDDTMVLDRLRVQRSVPEVADFRSWKAALHEAYSVVDPKQSLWHLPDGRTLRVAASPNAQGGVTYLFDDISEGVALASRFNALSNTQSETLDALADAVAVFASDGRMQLYNPAFRNLWQLDPAELSEKPEIGVIKHRCIEANPRTMRIWEKIERTLTSVGARVAQSERIEVEGGRTLDCSVTPLPDGGHLVSFRDVSDTVRVERILRERNAALIASDAIRDTVIRYISHDLRSPLTNISGYAEFLTTPEAGPLTERQRDFVGHISESSAELLAIIDSLQLAILDAGGSRMAAGEIEIRALLEAIARDSRARLAEREVRLEVEAPAEIGKFAADAPRVRQVLQNLVANAAGHSPAGETIRLSAERRPDAILFRVADRGPGIPADVQERLFQNLETLPIDSTHRAAGLGLSLVRSAMKLQGGEVIIDSAPNRGTVVTCVFPLTPPDTRNAAS